MLYNWVMVEFRKLGVSVFWKNFVYIKFSVLNDFVYLDLGKF